jgi:hypothetical protein
MARSLSNDKHYSVYLPKESLGLLTSSRVTTYHRSQDECYLALIFGTLLSSQGSDAHPLQSRDFCSGLAVPVYLIFFSLSSPGRCLLTRLTRTLHLAEWKMLRLA